MINWKVRIKNQAFWISLIPAVILIIQLVASLIGVDVDLSDMQQKLLSVVDAVFALLVVLGIVVDPTTEGIEDSTLAKTYTEPKKKGQ